jgi:hypothetical protein
MGKLKRLLLTLGAITAILLLLRASSNLEESLSHEPLDWKQCVCRTGVCSRLCVTTLEVFPRQASLTCVNEQGGAEKSQQ